MKEFIEFPNLVIFASCPLSLSIPILSEYFQEDKGYQNLKKNLNLKKNIKNKLNE